VNKMKNKGQTAMKYLMTYGWAILIVIVVVCALYAMGVFTEPEYKVTGDDAVKLCEEVCEKVETKENELVKYYDYDIDLTCRCKKYFNCITLSKDFIFCKDSKIEDYRLVE